MFSATILKEGAFQAEAAELKAVASPRVLDFSCRIPLCRSFGRGQICLKLTRPLQHSELRNDRPCHASRRDPRTQRSAEAELSKRPERTGGRLSKTLSTECTPLVPPLECLWDPALVGTTSQDGRLACHTRAWPVTTVPPDVVCHYTATTPPRNHPQKRGSGTRSA